MHCSHSVYKNAALKPKYAALAAQSSSGSVLVQFSVMWFFLLSHRFIIQLSSKTHVELNANRMEDPQLGLEQ